MKTLAIIPAKRRSTGVPDKNWKDLLGDEGSSCARLALAIGVQCCDRTYISTDGWPGYWFGDSLLDARWEVVKRPAELCQDDTPMLDVVKHALAQVPGPDDEIIVLLQPSSPLRTAETVKKAIDMLVRDEYTDCLASVSLTYPREWSFYLGDYIDLLARPTRRQACRPTYKLDGTVYAFRRKLVNEWGMIYSGMTLPFVTPPEESLSIDTEADWDEAVRRLSMRTTAASK